MDFEFYVRQQIQLHQNIEPQDLVKMCFQAAYGAEHLLSDISAAKRYFEKEYAEVEASNLPLYEAISDDFCRVNLSAWKAKAFPKQWLFQMFVNSATIVHGTKDLFCKYLDCTQQVLQEQMIFPLTEWEVYIKNYKQTAMSAVHHSNGYRQKNRPSYRIVNRKFMELLPILEHIANEQKENQVYVVAIDGKAGSGKTTLAKMLQQIVEGTIISMDDFFLPMELRTKQRLAEPGGNVHYERFIEEVLPYITQQQSFSYKIFDCKKKEFSGMRKIHDTYIRIVEGSYSCHPLFGQYANLTVFLDVEEQEQRKRIEKRNGIAWAKQFQNKWIPLENAYFEAYQIKACVDLQITSEGL